MPQKKGTKKLGSGLSNKGKSHKQDMKRDYKVPGLGDAPRYEPDEEWMEESLYRKSFPTLSPFDKPSRRTA